MKRTIPVNILIATLVVITFSCRKGNFAEEQYQAGVTINSSQLSSARLDVRFNGASAGDSLLPGASLKKQFDINGADAGQGKSMSFKVYKAGTDTLIVDTSFILHKNEQPVFNLVYSDELGLGGFVDLSAVPKDSIRIRIIFHDATAAKKFSKLEWQFYQFLPDVPFIDTSDNVKLIFSLEEGKYSADLLIPMYRKDNSTITGLYVRLKDLSTGNFLGQYEGLDIIDPGFSASVLGGGNYYFIKYELVDFPDGGFNCFALIPYTLQL